MGLAPPGVVVPDFFFDRLGRWFVNGEVITHGRTLDVLTKNLRWVESLGPNNQPGFVTSIGREVAPVRVEDVGLFVVDAELGETALTVHLSDQTSEELAQPELSQNTANELYCRVKSGQTWAKFTRPAYHRMAPYWRQRDAGFGLLVGDRLSVPGERG